MSDHAGDQLARESSLEKRVRELMHENEQLRLAADEAKAAAAVAEEKFEKTFEVSRDAMALVDMDAQLVVAANESFARLLDYPREEIIGKPPVLFHGLSPEADEAASKSLRSAGVLRDFELQQRTRTGEARDVLLSANVLTLHGKPHAVVVVRDVTEERRSAQSLRTLAEVIDQSPATVVIADLKGRIEYVNATFERQSGYSREEAIGQRVGIDSSQEYSAEFREQIWGLLRAGSSWQGQIVCKSKSGRLYTDDTLIAPLRDERGEICNVVAIRRDITEELALRQRLDAAQKSESIGQLAGGIAHDFNNILAVILGNARTLQEIHGVGIGEVGELSMEIVEAAERARELTRQLLAFARRQVIVPVPIDLNEAVLKAKQLLRRVLGEDIIMQRHLWPAPVFALCDPVQFEQVLMNLAVNARDAMPHGGTLTFGTSPLQHDERSLRAYPELAPGDYVEVTVSDDGAGMAPEVVARVFEPFFTTKGVGKGTGMGLATVDGIVKQSGGAIRCESEVGTGTTFSFCLPCATESARVEPAPLRARTSRRGTETLLLVEDDPAVRRTTLRMLDAAGYFVRVAKDGPSALDLVADPVEPLDLVITDVVMPGMDGGALVEQLRKARPGLRAIFVSGYAHEALLERSLLSDGVSFLSKPFAASELLERVRELLDQSVPPPTT